VSSHILVRGARRPYRKPDLLPAASRLGIVPEPIDLSVVVTVFNEKESITQLYEELVAALPDQKWEMVIVDDGSTDGSYEVAVDLHQSDRRVTVVKLRRNFGKTAALSAGFSAARGDTVVTMDGDLQDDPREIPKLLEALDSGYDLVTGWRRHRQDALSKRFSSFLFNKMVWYLTGVHLHDMNCGLKVCRAEVARELKLYGELHRFVPVLASQKGYRVGEVEVNHRPREHGRSKYGWGRAISALFDIQTVLFLTRYLDQPLRLFGSVGLGLAGLGFALGVYLTIIHFLGEEIGHRPILSLTGLLITSGLQMVSVGLIGEMLRNHSYDRQDEFSIESLLHGDQ
jgi:glycosyltransferase involved in cell wall biosynthesis